MRQKRILAVHDISCVGKCSLTVALPIISAAGVECAVLPTAVLSTHTGGFTGFTFRDLTGDIKPIGAHWSSLGIRFDAIYTGFLGSFEQIELVKELIDGMSGQDVKVYVDPVMADKGKMYSVFGPDFPAGMRSLCEKADLIMPNMTELAFMLGFEYKDVPYTREYVDDILDKAKAIGAPRIVITGISYEPGKIGAVYRDYVTGDQGEVMADEIPGYYHGTGDVFGSALVGALESGAALKDAVSMAVELTVSSIVRTHSACTDVRFGVNFECGLTQYARSIRDKAPLRIASTDDDIMSIDAMAKVVWPETYDPIIPEGQAEYMVKRFQTAEAIRKQISEGFVYEIARLDGEDVGYCGYKMEGEDVLYVSKLYVLAEGRKSGIGKLMLEAAMDAGRAVGAKRMHLSVNKSNVRAIEFYEHMGLVKESSYYGEVGDGFYYDDYRMGCDL